MLPLMLPVAARLAFQQLTHRGIRLAAALSGVCVAIILIFTQAGFRNALYDSAVAIPRALDADILVTAPTFHSWGDAPPWLPRALLYEAAGVPGVRSAHPLYVSALSLASPADGHGLSATLLAFSPRQPVFLQPDISKAAEALSLPDRALMDRESRDDFQLVRDSIENNAPLHLAVLNATESLQKTTEVSGLFSIGPSFTIDGMLVTSDLNFYRLTATPLDRVSLGVVRVKDGEDPQEMARAIGQKLGARARVFTRQAFIDNEIRYYAQETPIGYIFNMGLLVGAVVGVVFISQALHGIVHDNIREYATLRAMGYPQGFFVMLVSTISLAISLLGYLPSSLAAWGIYSLAAAETHLPLQMKAGDMLSILGLVVVMGLVATLLAIRKLRNADPVDLFT